MGVFLMKQKISAIFFCGALLACTPFAKANAVACGAGQYPYLSWCHGCAEGCYCKGPGFYQGAGYLGSCNPANGTMKFGALGKSSGWNDVYTCPKDFPKSKGGAKSEEDCYNDDGGEAVYNKSVDCPAGKYLPARKNACIACKDDSKSYCPGGAFRASLSSDQGIQECKEGEKPNATKTGCEEEIIQCEPDEIFTYNRKSCTKCEVGTHPNSSQTECVEAAAQSVQPGYYLPKGAGSKPKQCSESTYYCPGGDYTESSEDQGKFKCPKDTIANQKKTACVVKIKKEQLKKGPNENTPEEFQCWMNLTDIEKYKLCVIANPYYK